MREQKRNLRTLKIDSEWTLFLDRDGVINKRIENDYVRKWEQFEFLLGVIDAMKELSSIFNRIIIVTNQRGIGKGLMTEDDLKNIHNNMLKAFLKNGIKIDGIYHCPHDYEKKICDCRKPKIGMALQAKQDFPEIDFKKSIIVGDSEADMRFGKNLGMISVLIGTNSNLSSCADFCFGTLYEFSIFLKRMTSETAEGKASFKKRLKDIKFKRE